MFAKEEFKTTLKNIMSINDQWRQHCLTVNRLINCQLGKTSGTLVLTTINKKKRQKSTKQKPGLLYLARQAQV